MSAGRALHVVGAAILETGSCLVAQRGPRMKMPGKWEFPGGKIEPGESPRRALARELHEELGLAATVGDWLGRGESVADGTTIRLDVYTASADCAQLQPREHAAVRWVGASDLYEPDWAEADIPILPALCARLEEAATASHCPEPVTLIAADWGVDARKRAVYLAERDAEWSIERQVPEPGEGWTVDRLLALAAEEQTRSGHAVLVGLDVSLGIPAALSRRASNRGFLGFLEHLQRSDGLVAEAHAPEEWAPTRPFFRVPAGAGGKRRYFEAAGGETALLRQIEIRTRANTTFALSGIPGTVGSGARDVWRALAPHLHDAARTGDFRIWPFEGSLPSLLCEGHVVVAEIYPRAAYAVALADALPAPPETIAKTRRAARDAALARLERAPWLQTTRTSLPPLAHAAANEDDFDALLTAAAMVRAVAEKRPMSSPLVDPIAEGGILATGDVSLPEAPYRGNGGATRRAAAARTQ